MECRVGRRPSGGGDDRLRHRSRRGSTIGVDHSVGAYAQHRREDRSRSGPHAALHWAAQRSRTVGVRAAVLAGWLGRSGHPPHRRVGNRCWRSRWSCACAGPARLCLGRAQLGDEISKRQGMDRRGCMGRSIRDRCRANNWSREPTDKPDRSLYRRDRLVFAGGLGGTWRNGRFSNTGNSADRIAYERRILLGWRPHRWLEGIENFRRTGAFRASSVLYCCIGERSRSGRVGHNAGHSSAGQPFFDIRVGVRPGPHVQDRVAPGTALYCGSQSLDAASWRTQGDRRRPRVGVVVASCAQQNAGRRDRVCRPRYRGDRRSRGFVTCSQ